jgi:hypothetical protein
MASHRIRALAVVSLVLAAPTLGAERIVKFNRDVRPILSDKCFGCHGPDSVAKKIPLRLDSEGGAHSVVAGGAQAKLIQRITADDLSRRMPPVYSGSSLTSAEIETLRLWVTQGAKWEKHWSFTAPERSPLPEVKNTAWPRNPIDYFVLDRLEREGLAPSREAAREVLIRRVSLDLTGLPPTPLEVDAFVQDQSPKAYEKVIDRLLGSPRYGERMAARWLDGARYADSNGYQYDGERVMWRWRDWVIDAFNRNQPFDRFTVEQLAGDMLPNATLAQKIASGFNRNHRANTEDGIIPEEYAVEYVVDRVETTSAMFLGLTLGCARCHNHKYDPLTQKEFYQVFAYFNNVPEMGRAMKYGNSPPLVPAPTDEQQRAHDDLSRRTGVLEGYLRDRASVIEAAQRPWEAAMTKAEPAQWAPAGEVSLDLKASDGATFAPGRVGRAFSFDGKGYFNDGDAAAFDIDDRFTLSAWIYSDSGQDGSILTRMQETPRGRGYGILLNNGKVHVHFTSNYDDDAIRIETEETLSPKRWYHIAVTYTGSKMAEGARVYVNGKPTKVRVLLDTLYRPFRNAGRRFPEPLRVGAGAGPDRRFRGLIEDIHIYGRVLGDQDIAALALDESINAIASKPESGRNEIEKAALRSYFLTNGAPQEIRQAWEKLTALRLENEQLDRTFPSVMVMAENPVRKQTHVLLRGAYDKPGETVEPGVPSVLPPLAPGVANNRLGFAKWLVAPENPMLARVTVNRFWQMYFGTGIVKTVEDLGAQGEWPSHPELLDWLANEFVRTGWDVKGMRKLFVMSATYRQSSESKPELAERDPENRLFWRGPRFRLPAETIRDQALSVAGLLTERLGGPSVKPYQPDGLWKELAMQDMDYVQSKGPDLYRRSLYTFWKRTIAPPMMMNFDSAQRETCVVRETRTDTPLQALNLMNDVTFVEAARFLGQRMIRDGGRDADARLRYGFRLALGRAPSQAEQQILRDNLRFHLDYFAGKESEIDAFLSQGDSRPDPSLDRRELAAFASVASVLLNLDEMVTKQ